MKKLFRISILLTVLCFAVPVFADGDMTTGNKNCTQNCGLFSGINQEPTTLEDQNQDDSYMENLYFWFSKEVSAILD